MSIPQGKVQLAALCYLESPKWIGIYRPWRKPVWGDFCYRLCTGYLLLKFHPRWSVVFPFPDDPGSPHFWMNSPSLSKTEIRFNHSSVHTRCLESPERWMWAKTTRRQRLTGQRLRDVPLNPNWSMYSSSTVQTVTRLQGRTLGSLFHGLIRRAVRRGRVLRQQDGKNPSPPRVSWRPMVWLYRKLTGVICATMVPS
ncbi:MAG: hypothetical protein Ct9H300mP11_07440 [Chloroflexota bacterium]|nr:MAG: hypothetical protein Ct9H300mP11_07440 [Chloroflexota bacterium]